MVLVYKHDSKEKPVTLFQSTMSNPKTRVPIFLIVLIVLIALVVFACTVAGGQPANTADAPPSVLAAAVGDFAMLSVTVGALVLEGRGGTDST